MSGARTRGAVVGALVAGLGITAMLIAGERKSGKASELAQLERAGVHRLGVHPPPDERVPEASEQAFVQSGHLLLSAAAGAVYAASMDADDDGIVSGIGFGLAFYAAMHWILGPLLGVNQPEWRAGRRTIGMHLLNHVVFGLAAVAGAKLGTRAAE